MCAHRLVHAASSRYNFFTHDRKIRLEGGGVTGGRSNIYSGTKSRQVQIVSQHTSSQYIRVPQKTREREKERGLPQAATETEVEINVATKLKLVESQPHMRRV